MTDLFKVPERQSGVLARRLRDEPELIETSRRALRRELDDLGGPLPEMIVFGQMAHRWAGDLIPRLWYRSLTMVTHYSAWQFGADEYVARVRAEIGLG